MKKRKPFYIYIIVLFLIYCQIRYVYFWVHDVVPVTRTHFLTYQSFNRRTEFTIYPKELPKSAHDIHYYYYEGFLKDKSGYRATFSAEDYELMKENRLAAYHTYYCYRYDGESKLYFNREQIKQMRIDFIDRLLPEEKEDGQYYFLAYDLFEDSEIYSYDGVICNDETCEIIEFTYRSHTGG